MAQSTNVKQFLARMRALGKTVESNSDQVVKRASLAVMNVVTDTPVDTGLAKSNWVTTLNSPYTGTRKPYFPGKSGSTAKLNTDAAMAQATYTLSFYTYPSQVWVSNNLPYISRLNNGYSNQAPAGFVQTALISAESVVRSSFLLKEGIK